MLILFKAEILVTITNKNYRYFYGKGRNVVGNKISFIFPDTKSKINQRRYNIL